MSKKSTWNFLRHPCHFMFWSTQSCETTERLKKVNKPGHQNDYFTNQNEPSKFYS